MVFLIAGMGILFLMQLDRIAKPLDKDLPDSIGTITRASYLDSLAQFIRYYDEVLTQSARNYAFTREKKCRTRNYQAGKTIFLHGKAADKFQQSHFLQKKFGALIL